MRRRRFFIFTIIFSLSLPLSGLANPEDMLTTKTGALNLLDAQIHHVSNQLNVEKSTRQQLEQALQSAETTIGNLTNQLQQTQLELARQNEILAKLHEQQKNYLVELDKQRITLARQMRSAYMIGRHQYIKALLNQEHPADLSRVLEYFKYINRARMQVILSLEKTLANLETTQQQISLHTSTLAELQKHEESDKLKLTAKLSQRQRVLKQVVSTIETHAERLQQLQANKVALQNLVEKLKREAPVVLKPSLPFAKMKGRLHLPTRGAIATHFYDRILDSQLQYNAVFIKAQEGQPVRAIYPGRVVFANWFNGLGLLIIVDHGNGFLSLYGHNHNLNKQSGDLVNAGDEIASVGVSGGNDKSGLYFQLREQGKPLDPEVWCR